MVKTNNNLLESPVLLENDLLLRRSHAGDTDQLAKFNGRIHGDNEDDIEYVDAWTRDLMSGKHPTHHPEDFTIVEEKKTGKIVSAMNLISQVWSYDGIPFGVGRPELVGTDPAYRNRGLVRKQFEVIHGWSRQQGELLQAITGIPYFYRLFGYEMAVELAGRRLGFESHLPALGEKETEEYLIRPTVPGELKRIAQIYDASASTVRLHCVRDLDEWRYELDGRRENDVNRSVIRSIVHRDQLLGYLLHPPFLWNDSMNLTGIELVRGASWQNIMPAVIRFLWKQGQEYAKAKGKTCRAFGMQLGSDHLAYQVCLDRLPQISPPYAWYLRVADLAGFLKKITPALESHLENSNCSGYAGILKLGFYTRQIALEFKKGKITNIASSRLDQWDKVDAGFPGLTFLQLLFGYRSREELVFAFPDCWVNKDYRALMDALFPKKISHIWPIN